MNPLITFVATAFTALALFLGSGGHNFRWVQSGSNSWRVAERGHHLPTVVFEAGAGGTLENWVLVQPAVSQFARTFSYDRAGNGLSARGAPPRDARNIAMELRTLLRQAGVPAPYILVGHSLGGPFIRMFARLYPNDVAGMVLVDPTQEDLLAWARARRTESANQPSPVRPDDEVGSASLTFAEVANDRVAPHIPVILITGLGPREPPSFVSPALRKELLDDQLSVRAANLKYHRAWVQRAPRGTLLVTENSGHGIPWEEPELIINAIRQVIAQLRSVQPTTQ